MPTVLFFVACVLFFVLLLFVYCFFVLPTWVEVTTQFTRSPTRPLTNGLWPPASPPISPSSHSSHRQRFREDFFNFHITAVTATNQNTCGIKIVMMMKWVIKFTEMIILHSVCLFVYLSCCHLPPCSPSQWLIQQAILRCHCHHLQHKYYDDDMDYVNL